MIFNGQTVLQHQHQIGIYLIRVRFWIWTTIGSRGWMPSSDTCIRVRFWIRTTIGSRGWMPSSDTMTCIRLRFQIWQQLAFEIRCQPQTPATNNQHNKESVQQWWLAQVAKVNIGDEWQCQRWWGYLTAANKFPSHLQVGQSRQGLKGVATRKPPSRSNRASLGTLSGSQ